MLLIDLPNLQKGVDILHEITVEIGTQLKTVKITSNIFAVWHTLAMWQKKQYMHDQCDVVIILDLYAELYQAADEMIYTFDKQKWLHEKSAWASELQSWRDWQLRWDADQLCYQK